MSAGIWLDFRERDLPAQERWLARHLGREVGIQVDFDGFGHDPSAPEGVRYLLEMLVRGLDPEPWDPYDRRGAPVDRERLHAGIERVRIRRARTPGEIELAVREGCLFVTSQGSFQPDEVECLLTERGTARLDAWSNPPPAGLSEDLAAMRRWRLPPLLRRLEWSFGRPLPVELDWEGLDRAPHARADAGRLVLRALEGVADSGDELLRDPSIEGPMSDERRAREASRRAASRGVVGAAIARARVRAASDAEDATASLAAGVVEIDLGRARHAPRGREVAEAIREALALGVEALRTDLEIVDVPRARAHLAGLLDQAIADRGGRAQDRVALRRLLGAGPELAVDWSSFLAAGDRAHVLAALETLETGEYVHDRDHGRFFAPLVYALGEAIRSDASFLPTFLERVRRIEVELDPSPHRAAILVRGSSLLVRRGAEAGIDADGGASALVATVLGMPGPGDADETASVVSRMAELLGVRLECRGELESGLLEDAARAVVGTLRSLGEDPLARELLERGLESVELRPVDGPEGARFERGTLHLSVAGRRIPGPTEIRRALDDGLALAAAGRIADWERSDRTSWEEMLARPENFGRHVAVEVDWASFLAAPAGGGNEVVPYFVDDGAVKRLVYALTGWMADDPEFAARLREAVQGVRTVRVPDEAGARLELADGILVFGVASRTYHVDGGTFTIDELQMRLHELVAGPN